MTKKLPRHTKHKRLVYLITALSVGVIDMLMVLGVLVFKFSPETDIDGQTSKSQVLGNHSTYKFDEPPNKYDFNPLAGILNLALGSANVRTFESVVPRKINFPKDKFINKLKFRPTPTMTPTVSPTPSLTTFPTPTTTPSYSRTPTPTTRLNTPTNTPVTVNATATPTSTQNSSPTSTPTTASANPTPTRTPTPSPTKTPIPTATKTPTPTPTTASQSGTNQSVFVTFYGWNDNTPPGPDIAYAKNYGQPTIHNSAGGTGTYDDPITFAALTNVYAIGTRIYVPYVKKYAILEDICGGCTGSGYPHIDLWMESNGNLGDKLIECQHRWTRDPEIIEVNPPPGRQVNTTPFFNSSNGECQQSM